MKLNRINSIMAKSVATLAACAALNATAGTAPAPKNPAPVAPEPTSLFDSIGATLDLGGGPLDRAIACDESGCVTVPPPGRAPIAAR